MRHGPQGEVRRDLGAVLREVLLEAVVRDGRGVAREAVDVDGEAGEDLALCSCWCWGGGGVHGSGVVEHVDDGVVGAGEGGRGDEGVEGGVVGAGAGAGGVGKAGPAGEAGGELGLEFGVAGGAPVVRAAGFGALVAGGGRVVGVVGSTGGLGGRWHGECGCGDVSDGGDGDWMAFVVVVLVVVVEL